MITLILACLATGLVGFLAGRWSVQQPAPTEAPSLLDLAARELTKLADEEMDPATSGLYKHNHVTAVLSKKFPDSTGLDRAEAINRALRYRGKK